MARHLQFSFMVLVFLLPACGGEVALEQQRGVYTSQGAAKADGTDSCQGACGGQSLSGGWCDAECKFYGDCCSDIDTVCNGTSQTCADLSCGMGHHCEMKGINGGAIPVCIKD